MPVIENKKIVELADEIEDILSKMPPIKTFEKRDPSNHIDLIPDYSLEALKLNKSTMNMLLGKVEILKEENLNSYDVLALEQIEYFIKYLMFPISPLMEDFYWIMFEITPYNSPLFFMWQYLSKHDISTEVGVESRIKLAKDYLRFTNDMKVKFFEQIKRNIYIFEFAIDSCIVFLKTYEEFDVKTHPLSLYKEDSIASEIQKETVMEYLKEASNNIKEIMAELSKDTYRENAPKNPGYAQYPNGKEYYDYMREFHIGYDLSSEELNDIGWKYLKLNNDEQEKIRKKFGFEGTNDSFLEDLKSNEKVYPKSPEALDILMNSFNKKVENILGDYFEKIPSTPCCAKRLDPMHEKTMTFGYFGIEADDEGKDIGVYRFSGYGVDGSKNQIVASSLIAHELQPGHHFQESIVRESEDIHSLFRRFGNTGYGDGWAEYSAMLMGEVGLYDDLDYYGMIEGDKFLCIRLIADTGMNELGYSIEKARKIIREETYANEAMVMSESVRYSACIPGQCLPYKYGKLKFFELRDMYQSITKEKFDIKKFHSLVLEVGNVPLPILERYVEREAKKHAEC